MAKKVKISLLDTASKEELENVHVVGVNMSTKKNVKVPVSLIGSGGDSSAGGVTMKLKSVSETLLSAVEGMTLQISYNFTSIYTDDGTETGGGTATYSVNSQKVATASINQGDNVFDVSRWLTVGTNTVTVNVKDTTGSSRTLVYTVELISLSIQSSFDATEAFTGEIIFKYTPQGAISKVVHFVLDGRELDTVTTTVSNRELSYVIPAQSHGSHLLKVFMTATVNGIEVKSNTLTFDLICISASTTPVITSNFSQTNATQYDTLYIPFMVYDPTQSTAQVTMSVNGVVVSTQTVDRTEHVWNYRLDTTGEVTLKIACGSVYKQFTLTVSESSINVHPETVGLELHLTAANRSNSDDNRDSWSYGDITAQLTDFNYKTNGWLPSEGSTVLRVSGDARVAIPYKIFASDFRAGGKTLEFEFETRDVTDYNAIVINCMNGAIGFQMTAQEATFKSEQTTVTTQFKEEERVRVSFVIEKKSAHRLIQIYINGVMSGTAQYPEQDNFQQRTPVDIVIGSKDCTVDLYNIRVYNNDLTQYQVLDNYIGDIDDFSKKLNIYLRNQVHNNYGDISYDLVLNQLPCLTIIGDLPQYKGDKKTVTLIYTDKQNPKNSWIAYNVQIDVQGTSSQYYPRKNYKVKCKGGFVMSDSGLKVAKVALRDNAIPVDTFCFKADFAESSGTHNTGMAKIVDKLLKDLKYLTPPQKRNSQIRTTIDGFPVATFHKQSEEGELGFVGKYNFNNDKSTEETFGFSKGNESWEFRNNTSDRVLFKASDYSTDDWLNDFEARYPEDNTNYTNLKIVTDWVVSTKGNPEKFKAEVAKHFDVNNLVLYYLVTELFAMVDQRAKNMFLTTFGREAGSADFIWRFIFYDNDTCFGINNEGLRVFNYDVEYHDREGSLNVWNGESSVLWNNVEVAFKDEIEAMYKEIRSKGYLSYDYVMSVLNGEQSDKWCEAIYNADSKFKYIDPLIEEGNGSYLYAAQGSRKEHRKWWTYNRFLYMDSKYTAGDFLSDFATLRLYTPATWTGVEPNANFTITPFADQYTRVKYGSYIVGSRGKKGVPMTIAAPNIVFNDTETIIYGASRIKSLGDLSGLYAGTIDVSKAIRLVELLIGSGVEGYHNDNLTVLAVGANRMLRRLDTRNCPNLRQPIDLSGCDSIEHVLAQGTSITAVVLPEAGVLIELRLPATISNLTIKNQPKLVDSGFELAGVEALSTVVIENTNINILGIIERCLSLPHTALNRVRLIGINGGGNTLDTLHKLMSIGGIDENGNNTQRAVITGKYHVAVAREDQLAELQEAFPELIITYSQLKPPTVTTFVFKSSQSKTITNSSFECNFPYKKVDEATYTVVADDDTTISYTFRCDNHEDYSYNYLVGGTRTENIVITYIPLLTLRIRVYNTSTYPSGATVTIDGQTYTSDANGYVYIRSRKVLNGTVSALGYEIESFTISQQVNDYTSIIYVYQSVDIKFIIKDEYESLIAGSTITCNGETKITNRYGECIFRLSKGSYDYEVTNSRYESKTGKISVGTSGSALAIRTNIVWENYAPEENGNIQMVLKNSSDTRYGTNLEITSMDSAYVIDWGDGTITEAVGEGIQRYEHLYSTSAIYNVEVRNCENVTYCNCYYDKNSSIGSSIAHSLYAYWSIGNSQVKGLNFYFNTTTVKRLIAIGDIFKNDIERTDFSHCFDCCSSLKVIPSNWLANCFNVTNMSYCFRECSGLSKIIAEILKINCEKVVDLSYAFYSLSKESHLPSGLLDNFVSVTNLDYAFYKWNASSIPDGLLDNCTNLLSVNNAFGYWNNGEYIPANLFDMSPKITTFDSCFYGWSLFSNPVPRIWETHPLASGKDCFYNFKWASNWEDIPYSWGGPLVKDSRLRIRVFKDNAWYLNQKVVVNGVQLIQESSGHYFGNVTYLRFTEIEVIVNDVYKQYIYDDGERTAFDVFLGDCSEIAVFYDFTKGAIPDSIVVRNDGWFYDSNLECVRSPDITTEDGITTLIIHPSLEHGREFYICFEESTIIRRGDGSARNYALITGSRGTQYSHIYYPFRTVVTSMPVGASGINEDNIEFKYSMSVDDTTCLNAVCIKQIISYSKSAPRLPADFVPATPAALSLKSGAILADYRALDARLAKVEEQLNLRQ